jgi:alpha-L-rhamnosidase
MKLPVALLVLLTAIGLRTIAGETAIPENWPENRYSAMSRQSPFSLATAAVPAVAPQGSFAANWFVSGLAGIKQSPGSVGYRHLDIAPAVVGDLTHASGTYQTPNGQVTSSWRKTASGRITLKVTIPGGTAATVRLPGRAPVEADAGQHTFHTES